MIKTERCKLRTGDWIVETRLQKFDWLASLKWRCCKWSTWLFDRGINAGRTKRRKECGAKLGEFTDAAADGNGDGDGNGGDEASLCMASARFVTNWKHCRRCTFTATFLLPRIHCTPLYSIHLVIHSFIHSFAATLLRGSQQWCHLMNVATVSTATEIQNDFYRL